MSNTAIQPLYRTSLSLGLHMHIIRNDSVISRIAIGTNVLYLKQFQLIPEFLACFDVTTPQLNAANTLTIAIIR